MKRLTIIGFLWGLIAVGGFACDDCGGIAGSPYFGIMPQYQKHFIGLRYDYQSFSTTHAASWVNGTSAFQTRDQYHTWQLVGRYSPHRRIQVLAQVPYRLNLQKRNDDSDYLLQMSGLGDVQLSTQYAIVQSSDTTESDWTQEWWLGGGVKLPTGKWHQTIDGHSVHPNLQLGTGAFAIAARSLYSVRYKQWGMQAAFNYQWNFENSSSWRLGDQLATEIQFFHWYQKGKNAWLPQLGVGIDWMGDNAEAGETIFNSGSMTTFLTVGCQYSTATWSLGLRVQQPIARQSTLRTQYLPRGGVQFLYFI